MESQTLSNLSIALSSISLTLSGITAWLTLFRKGTIKMTQPTVIFFGPDGDSGPPKVFLRTLLYSTAKHGQVVENMYVKLYRGESAQTFNIWVYGEQSFVRGSGLHVGEEGVPHNHHFLLPKDGTRYEFLAGEYKVEVYASLINKRQPILLSKSELMLTKEQATAICDNHAGVYFDWGPDSRTYHSHVDEKPSPRLRQLVEQAYKGQIPQRSVPPVSSEALELADTARMLLTARVRGAHFHCAEREQKEHPRRVIASSSSPSLPATWH